VAGPETLLQPGVDAQAQAPGITAGRARLAGGGSIEGGDGRATGAEFTPVDGTRAGVAWGKT